MKKQVRFTLKKIVFSMVVVLIATVVLSGCKKGATPDPTPPKEDLTAILIKAKWNVSGSEFKIDGAWKSKPVTMSLKQFLNFNDITFKKAGTLQLTSQRQNDTKSLGGTWTLSGKTLLIDPDDMSAQSYAVETLDNNSLVITYSVNTMLADPENEQNYVQVSDLRLKLTH